MAEGEGGDDDAKHLTEAHISPPGPTPGGPPPRPPPGPPTPPSSEDPRSR
jgi:hypothetical protein